MEVPKEGNVSIGDKIVVSVKDATQVLREQFQSMLSSEPKRKSVEKDGSYIRFDDNARCIALTTQMIVPLVSLVPLLRGLRDRDYMRIVSLVLEGTLN